MLKLKPNCEACDKDLPANSHLAMICSYECTFCQPCVENILHNVCPNCGGGLTPRPIRPQTARRAGVSLKHQPGSEERVNSPYSLQEIREFAEQHRHIEAQDR